MARSVERGRSDYETQGWAVSRSIVISSLRESAVKWLNQAAAKAESVPTLEPEFEATIREGRPAVRKLRRLVWNDAPFWSDWLAHSGILKLGSSYITGKPAIVFHAAFLKPGHIGSRVALHQDQALWSYEYPNAVSVWVALSDSTHQNGCLQVCTGSHLGGLLPHRFDPEYPWHACLDPKLDGLPPAQEILMAQGDALVWHRYMVHGSAANNAGEDRIGMVVVFADAAAPNFAAKDFMEVKI